VLPSGIKIPGEVLRGDVKSRFRKVNPVEVQCYYRFIDSVRCSELSGAFVVVPVAEYAMVSIGPIRKIQSFWFCSKTYFTHGHCSCKNGEICSLFWVDKKREGFSFHINPIMRNVPRGLKRTPITRPFFI
jgi:hypothetical protein